ncbi:MAG: guanylate kinase [Porphyromonas sp.]|nr:guanylate kinase [Porphyromonas sp.]
MTDKRGKLIIFSAPSGSGKSTIINELTTKYGLQGRFSISATSRAPRGEEKDGVHYHFLTTQEFKDRIGKQDFLEYEEVYEGCFYGTLKSEIDNTLARGEVALLDIDVKGALNVKRIYGDQALTLFIQPPGLDTLRQRLEGRGTDSPEKIAQRLAKAEYELSFAPFFDKRVINDDLEVACNKASRIINRFINNEKRVLLYPGSFNPLHVGHLALANYLIEELEDRFDELWFLLTPNSPFKKQCELLPSDFRAAWISHLIQNHPKLRLSQEEENLEAPYYTINTVRYLKAKYPETRFSLLIGADSLITLPEWHKSAELIDEIDILAFPRPGYDPSVVDSQTLSRVEVLTDVPTFRISSTLVRELLRSGKALPYLLGIDISHPLYRQLHEELLKSDCPD